MNISEQYRVAVVSTGHVKKEDAELLDKVCNDDLSGQGLFWIEKNRYGWILRISASEQWRVELTRAGISASALDNIAALNGAGFDWIWFDRDAEQVPELTVWEW
ncbi:hypothetical protein NLO87_18305 [Escherichia coli]|nr:hypothetical protein [Escherichia coli]HDV9845506.1 hypothetical protein [Escherichia coli]